MQKRVRTRVVFVDQSGGRSSGAQESLALLLKGLPTNLEAHVVLFEHGEYEQRLRDRGFNVAVFPIGPSLLRASRYGSHLPNALLSGGDVIRLCALLRSLEPDIVHTNTVKAHLIGVPAARIIGVPSVMHIRDALTKGGRFALSALGRYGATRSIAVSHFIARWYDTRNARVIYNPVDLSFYENMPDKVVARKALGLPAVGPLVGIVGPVHPGKGHERFLRILAHLAISTDIKGVIVGDARFGDTHLQKRLEEQATSLGLANRVFFIPWLNDPRPAYAALDVLCNCSASEPFGRSVAEAAASGTATMMFNNAGVAELFGMESTMLVQPYDEARFAEGLIKLTDDRHMLTSVSERAKAAVQDLTIARHVAQVLQVYDEVLS